MTHQPLRVQRKGELRKGTEESNNEHEEIKANDSDEMEEILMCPLPPPAAS